MRNSISISSIALIFNAIALIGSVWWGVGNLKTTTSTLQISVDSLTVAVGTLSGNVTEMGKQLNRHEVDLAVLKAVKDERAKAAGSE